MNQNASHDKPPSAFPRACVPGIVFLLCLLAAIHVFIFSAAFPFFNNVDEEMHFDLVVKYSQAHLPRGFEPFAPDSCPYVAFFTSHAYREKPDQLLPPLWTEPVAKMRPEFELKRVMALSLQNFEASQTPLYYALAAIWWHIGQWLDFNEGHLLYWLRFFNVLQVIAVVWLAAAIARMIFPENAFIQVAVPALVAFMPQTAFYSLGNDLLSPLCFGITFGCLLKWLSSESPSALLGAATGLAFAATYLAKATNFPLLAVVGAALLFKTGQSLWRKESPPLLPLQRFNASTLQPFVVFLCCALPPIAAWMIWCKLNFGDLAGAKFKADIFGWTLKPFGEWWQHPIFTPAGFWTYLSGILATFWQGQFKWHGQPLVLPGSNLVYTILTLILLVAVIPSLLPRASRPSFGAKADQPFNASQRRALQLSLICFVAGLVFFALNSIRYDFHKFILPSRHYPYFAFGRLLLGALIPLLLLLVCGLDRVLTRFGITIKFIALAVIISAMLVTEIATDWPVFFSPFNLFHLP